MVVGDAGPQRGNEQHRAGGRNDDVERLGPLVMEGLEHEGARRKLNARIDEVLRAFSDTQRVSERQGTYEVFSSVLKTPETMLGVERARKVLSRVIEAIERG